MTSTVTATVALTVAFVWAISMLADVIVRPYDPPAAIHAALMAVLGYIFKIRLSRGGGE